MKPHRQKNIWIAQCEDVFGCNGLLATGYTAHEAKSALWQAYKDISPRWNSDSKQFLKNIKQLNDYFGIDVRRVTIGHAYFGEEDDRDDLKYYEHKPKLK